MKTFNTNSIGTLNLLDALRFIKKNVQWLLLQVIKVIKT